MKYYNLEKYLLSLPYAHYNGDRTHIIARCPFCGDSPDHQDSTNFYIKVNSEEGEAFLYICFRAICREAGALRTSTLMKFGNPEIQAILELSKHNNTVSKNFDSGFNYKYKKGYDIVNVNHKLNQKKLTYINNRLGLDLTTKDLKRFKIQLSIRDFIRINDINKTTVGVKMIDAIENNCIGFISAYDDYIILRDMTNGTVTGNRYINYRIRKTVEETDTKIYIIPTEIDLLSPEPTVIHIAEGGISILGAYHHTDFDRDEYPNQIFASNNGAGYVSTIKHICSQYGLTDIIVNVYSDSEIKPKFYNDVVTTLRENFILRRFTLRYNRKKDDFGHSKDNIRVESSTLYDRDKNREVSIRL